MKFRSSIVAAIIIAGIFLGAYYPSVNQKEKESTLIAAVLDIMNQVHFKPKKINDDFSEKVFDNYLKMIDGSKRFLIQSEVDQLATYKHKLDNQAKDRAFDFFELSLELLDKSLIRSERIYSEVMDMDFDLEKNEIIELDSEKRKFPVDEAGIRENWRKSLKYEVVSRLERKLSAQEDKKNEKVEPVSAEEVKMIKSADEVKEVEKEKTKEELLVDIKADVRDLFNDWFKRMSKLRREDRFEAYINAFTNQFDPHSGYFSPKDKQDFDIRMGGKLEGIGARLQTEDDFTKVVSIVPGGPAWKGKDLEVDDLIMGVAQDEGEFVDINGMRIDDVVQLIRGKKGTIVKLNIKKKDGSVEEVVIERDEVIIDESFARSVLLSQSDVIDNVGYIKLPKFYSSFEGNNGNSCAKDVAKEIEKLKEANVKGIVLDLRYNGGGSLKDVIEMTGLFIEEGPIVQVKSKGRAPYEYKDEDASVLWDGPLVVMVNSYSASASEILAAALQDYNRALIVGSTTFGKGTVQRFFDLDNAVRGNSDVKPLGELKLTMQKFYRVNGGSTQLKGVEPDIVLADRFAHIDVGEREYDNAMEWSEIAAKNYSQDDYQLPALTSLRSKSEARVKNDAKFNKVAENALRLKANRDQTSFPLGLDAFSQKMDERENEAKKYEDLLDEKLEGLVASNLQVDLDYINSDESIADRNKDWVEGIHKDIYLVEVLNIMNDLIAINP